MYTLSPIIVLLACLPVSIAEEASPNDRLKAAYERFVEAGTWQERANARKELTSFGERALPFLIDATRHEKKDVREEAYTALISKFPAKEETAKAVVRGLNDDSARVRYMTAFFAGTERIKAAEPRLREIYEDPKHDLHLTAAKSLAQLGHADVIRTLYYAAGSDWYMKRHQANIGLKALSGKDLDDFAGYQYGEGVFVSGGNEYVGMLHPIEDAELKAKRFTALAEFCKWLEGERPDLYKVLDPHFGDTFEFPERR